MSNKIPYETRCEVYDKALHKWGMVTQMLVAIEEMSEVIKAITKLERCNSGEHTNEEYCAALDSLIEEIADATIMLEQVRYIFGINEEVCEVMDEKIMRLLDRAKKAEVGE